MEMWKEHKWITISFIVLLFLLLFYVTASRITPSTSDAYVEAHVVQIAPRVSGRVVKVDVANNALVKKGQLLFELDSRIYEHDLNQALGVLNQAENHTKSLTAQVETQTEIVNESKSNFLYAKQQYDAYKKLVGNQYVSQIKFDSITNQYKKSALEYTKAQAELMVIQDQLHKTDGMYAQIQTAQAAYDRAKQNLESTKIYAPFEGRVTFLRVSPGMYAEESAPVMSLIDVRHWWIIARIKENNLGRIRPGQLVDISPELYPNLILKGQVNSVGWGVNLTPEIPPVWMPYIPKTRNWVQLAQRFPVEIDVVQDPRYPLRVGSTVSVTIYTEKWGVMNIIGHIRQRIMSWFQYLY